LDHSFQSAYRSGFERLVAWARVLDDINVFPVADGDTGRNLVLTLSPLRHPHRLADPLRQQLLLSARGNSGNIAARFLSGLLQADSKDALPAAALAGKRLAREAVPEPRDGTMLTVFDALVDYLACHGFEDSRQFTAELVQRLAEVVAGTPDLLPKLKRAGVVDAGALGMFIFFEGVFKSMGGHDLEEFPLVDFFKGSLQVSPAFREKIEAGYCIDTVIQIDPAAGDPLDAVSGLGESVVVISDADRLKVHLHATDAAAARRQLSGIGPVLHWAADNLSLQTEGFRERGAGGAIHIMTDAAGSITRDAARRLGITLLDSYVLTAEKALPETLCDPAEIYTAMRAGEKISTAQASEYERHQYYRRMLSQFDRVLYLCVGAVYTGNYQVACAWKRRNDPEDRMAVIDTTAASGRLGAIVRAVARFAQECQDPAAVIAFARGVIPRCEEYIFLDRLKYLAAGGRLSRKGAFMGDMLHLRPVISPTAAGARKVGAVHRREGQIQFALARLRRRPADAFSGEILLQYSDNREWVADVVRPRIQSHHPGAEILVHPLSLTSGVHMGPGTWAMAFLRDAQGGARGPDPKASTGKE
jgi:hypothetical protein